jgi:hypothetical protein
MKRLLALVIALAFGGAALAAEGRDSSGDGVFWQWLRPDSPACVPVAEIKKVASVQTMTPDQFQFIRTAYIFIPPMSKELPAGDSAALASQDGLVMAMLITHGADPKDEGRACSRFIAPGFVLEMLRKVGAGENGEPAGRPL